MERWNKKIAVVTGGSSGMGEAVAAKFLKSGLTVINLDINVQENTTSTDEKLINRKCDVADADSIKENFAWIEQTFGVIHILVNCAGVVFANPIIDPRDEISDKIDKTIDINLRGTIRCTREAVKLMVKSDDYCLIVNLCSILGHVHPFMGFSVGAYHATKNAVKSFSETVRQELIICKSEKIRVSNISPGGVRTNMLKNALSESELAKFKVIEADDVADAILFLLTTPYNVNITELTIRPVGENL